MIGDIIEDWFSERVRLPACIQVALRLFFGLLGAALALAGIVVFGFQRPWTTNTPMRISFVALLVSMACFCLINVTLNRKSRWPARLFIATFVALILTRFLFGP